MRFLDQPENSDLSIGLAILTGSPRTTHFFFYVMNVDLTVAFEHFEDPRSLIILNILKEKLVISYIVGSFYLDII